MRTNLTFPKISSEPSLNTREICTARGTTMKNFLMKLWKRLCLNLFSKGEWKCLVHLMASCCMINWGLTFSPLLNCYILIWKISYDWSEPDLISTWLATTRTSVLELLIVHFTLFILLSRMIITRNEWHCIHSLHTYDLHTLLWSSTSWKLLQRLSSVLPDKTSSFRKTFSTMLEFVGLLLQWVQTLHSLDFIL